MRNNTCCSKRLGKSWKENWEVVAGLARFACAYGDGMAVIGSALLEATAVRKNGYAPK